MKFHAKLDDEESRLFWDTVRRGARDYDDLPAWKKGVLGGVECTRSDDSGDPDENDGRKDRDERGAA